MLAVCRVYKTNSQNEFLFLNFHVYFLMLQNANLLYIKFFQLACLYKWWPSIISLSIWYYWEKTLSSIFHRVNSLEQKSSTSSVIKGSVTINCSSLGFSQHTWNGTDNWWKFLITISQLCSNRCESVTK